MPPPLLGRGPYGSADLLLQKEDPWGWPVTEYEEGFELSPGLSVIAQSLLEKMMHLTNGRPAHGIATSRQINIKLKPRAFCLLFC
jgi:hypothetical protein